VESVSPLLLLLVGGLRKSCRVRENVLDDAQAHEGRRDLGRVGPLDGTGVHLGPALIELEGGHALHAAVRLQLLRLVHIHLTRVWGFGFRA